ncbi:MAG: metallophosphoesterase family protein [Burkholderiales bacterium]
MQIQILSDLHLEFSERHPPFEPPTTGAEVIVLAGDIDTGTRAIDWAEATFPGKSVIYVPGNHEYYGEDFAETAMALRTRADASPDLHLLDNDEVVLGDVRFIGTTLWTDFELFGRQQAGPAVEESLQYVLDFRAISWGVGALLTPERAMQLHREARAFIEERLARPFSGTTVVITHHAPHRGSLHPRWADNLTSAAFVSDLTHLLGKSDLWIHGHTHDSFDYTVNGTRVLANPMGYRTSNWHEARDGRTPALVKYENERFDPALTVRV